jgi:hypothetical protein
MIVERYMSARGRHPPVDVRIERLSAEPGESDRRTESFAIVRVPSRSPESATELLVVERCHLQSLVQLRCEDSYKHGHSCVDRALPDRLNDADFEAWGIRQTDYYLVQTAHRYHYLRMSG